MKKLYEKHEFLITMILIISYILINSICMNNFGTGDYRSTIINTILSILILIFIIKIDKVKYFGLTKITSYKKYLYFIPLIILISVNLWGGINLDNKISYIIFYILTMINIGFLEEIIFRGFLFKMMEKDSIKTAVIVSSLTFGIGHILNLLNGADLIPTLLQIIYATSTGFMFVIIFIKSKSIMPCIITHSLVNALSVFEVSTFITIYIAPIILTIIPIIYSIYLIKKIK